MLLDNSISAGMRPGVIAGIENLDLHLILWISPPSIPTVVVLKVRGLQVANPKPLGRDSSSGGGCAQL